MFGYLINRWAFARRFEQSGADYIYRRRVDLPGIVMSDEERRDCLREYRRRYWKSFAILIGGMLAAATVLVLIAMGMNSTSAKPFMNVTVYVLVAIVCVVVFRDQRERALIPERRFPDRPRVASSQPTGNWIVRYQTLAKRRSWPVYAVLLTIYGSITWLLVLPALGASAIHWGAFLLFSACFAMLVYGAVLKARMQA